MSECSRCRDITSEDREPCPASPPCPSENICGYRVTRCIHKERAADRAARQRHLKYLASLRDEGKLDADVQEGAPESEHDWNAAHVDPYWP